MGNGKPGNHWRKLSPGVRSAKPEQAPDQRSRVSPTSQEDVLADLTNASD